jgi:hypothetical protein
MKRELNRSAEVTKKSQKLNDTFTEAEVLDIVNHVLQERWSDDLNIGVQVEKEHRSTYDLVKKYAAQGRVIPENIFYLSIVKDHLAETPDYYTQLAKAGL